MARYADALRKGTDDIDLLVSGEDIHGGLNPSLDRPEAGPRKSALNLLYAVEWSLLRGSIPGF